MDEADKDLTARKRRSQEEEELEKRTGNLEELKLEVRDSIRDEMSELKMIKENCVTDLRNIGGCGRLEMSGCGRLTEWVLQVDRVGEVGV